ncbi:TniQ family protein [Burkholderia vietnamiensis]|uniref:TniQ family protein n=2 Tax=Burkholderia vietnamiensis TaxID=60552 RepID=UPI0009C06AA6|nr:TniQ family protein [Burkholderia vietnamiensis]MBR8081529.1 TniQ family protein [Burkholderia vietnamiensis]MCA7988891.1 TniQ family protein [Burkholderia vietnamiensis]HDR8936146.1 TniQ family protein [Burkholderia vietnamiensis]HDR8987270.1 TniQ family protein [Burkholderia vietnamiensis]
MENQSSVPCSPRPANAMLRLPLALRVEPYPDESLSSVLMRLVDANGLRSVGALLRDAGCVAFGPLVSAEIAELSRVCRIGQSTMRSMCPVEVGGRARGTSFGYAIGHHVIEARHLLVRERERICPLCLLDGGIMLASHRLTWMTACRVHSVQLLDVCPQCEKPIMVTRPSMVQCRCGLDLSRISPITCTLDEAENARYLYQRWCLPTTTGSGVSEGLAAVEKLIDFRRAAGVKNRSGTVDRRAVPLHQIRNVLGFS